jgi:hypothetical protein
MTLEFTLSEKDIVDFNVFHLLNEPKIRKREMMRKYFVTGFLIFLYFAFSAKYHGMNPHSYLYYLPVLACAALWFRFYQSFYRYSVLRKVRKILNANPGSGLTGKYVIKTGKTAFSITTESGGNKYKNSEIVEVHQTDTFIYLYRDGNTAIAVPKNVFVKDQEKEFLALFSK